MNCDHLTNHYLELAEQILDEAFGEKRAYWIQRGVEELPQIRTVLDWLYSQGDVVRGLRLTYLLQEIWFEEAHTVEGLNWLEKFLDLPSDDVSSKLRALCLDLAGAFALNLGKYDRAQQLKEEAIILLQQIEEYPQLGYSLMHLGHLMGDAQGELEQAERLYTEALGIFRELDDVCGITRATGNLAKTYYDLDNTAMTHTMLYECISKHAQCDNPWELALYIGIAAGFLLKRGSYKTAVQLAAASKTHQERLGVSTPDVFQKRFKTIISAIQEDERFLSHQAEWQEGAQFELDTAVELAFNTLSQFKFT